MDTVHQAIWLWYFFCKLHGQTRALICKKKIPVETLFQASLKELTDLEICKEDAEKLLEHRDLEPYIQQVRNLAGQQIQLIPRDHPLFSGDLRCYVRQVLPHVELLFAMGDISLLSRKSIAIVGARKSSIYGESAARYLSERLARQGYVIVSGMASGIDAVAHKGALSVGGATIAVLGCGVDVCYPAGNRQLYELIKRKGLILSEYPPGSTPLPYCFPMRNRIIAALSNALIVVEASMGSGSLITEEYATELGLQVFAVPGSMFDAGFAGSNHIISRGASIITNWEDLLLALGEQQEEENICFENDEQREIYRILSRIPVSFENLLARTGLETGRLLMRLTELEMNHLAGRSADGSWMRC